MCFTVGQRASWKTPNVMIEGLFSGAVGFLHKRKLQSTAEGRRECGLMSLDVNVLELSWECAGLSSSGMQFFRPPLCLVHPLSHSPLFSFDGTVITKSGSNSPEIKPLVSSEGRSAWLHGVKMPHNKDFQWILLLHPALPPPPKIPGRAISWAFWHSGVN